MASKEDIATVFEAWRAGQKRPGLCRLTPARAKLIAARLERASAEDLATLMQYAYEAETPEARWWRGEDGGMSYLGLDNLLRIGKLDDRIDRAREWVGESDDGDLVTRQDEGADDLEDEDEGIIFSTVGAMRRRG